MAEIAIAAETSTKIPGSSVRTGHANGIFIRFAPVTLSANMDDTCTVPQLFIDSVRHLIWFIRGDQVSLNTRMDLYAQTTFDGTNWYDVRNVRFSVGDPELPSPAVTMVMFDLNSSSTIVGKHGGVNYTDGAIPANSSVTLPLGIGARLRIKTTDAASGTLYVACFARQ
jgi:hypothetical protein